MFWKKEKFTGNNLPYFIDSEGTYRRLVTEEEWDKMKEKLNLILDHLNLEYVPESEKKEPAKLVEKKEYLFNISAGLGGITDCVVSGGVITLEKEPKKKKRGRPKKK